MNESIVDLNELSEVEMPQSNKHSTHSARVTNPISFVAPNGRKRTIPVGPCLIEELNSNQVDLVWGPAGEKSAVLPASATERAAREGKLVLLD